VEAGVAVAEPARATWKGTDVDVTTIERQLSCLWTGLAGKNNQAHAVRTSLYNLLVYTESEDNARSIADSLSKLSQRQPSRAIILIADRYASKSTVDVEMAVQCHTVGDRRLGHEQLLVTARGRTADHVASLSIPLMMPELPTYLWWPGQPPFGHRKFHRLLHVASQLIVDSAEFISPGDGLANLVRVCTLNQGVNDIHWARLAQWREIVAQFFDPPIYLPYASNVRSVRIECGGGGNDLHRVTAGVLLLVGWTARQLGWDPETTMDNVIDRDVELAVTQGDRVIPIQIQFRDHGSGLAGRLCALEMVSQPQDLPPARFKVERMENSENGRASVHIHERNEITRVVPIASKDEAEILGDELEMAGQDTVYGHIVEMASRLAGRQAWVTT